LIGKQVYSSHKYEFAVTASQFRFITINLVARVAQQTLSTRNRCFMGTVAYGCTWVANSHFLMCVVPHPVVSNGRGASNWFCDYMALQTRT